MKKIIEHPRFGEVVISRTRRARRISVSVRPPGKVRVSIPHLCPVRSGIAFLNEKEDWIAETIEKMQEKHPVRILEPPYHTVHRELVLKPCDTDKISSRVTAKSIAVSYPSNKNHTSPEVQQAIRSALLRAMQAEAKEYLPPLVEELAAEHGFRFRSVTIRNTVTRWGSCSSQNDISLSVYLMGLPQHLIEYVILHELCHTRHKDHSDKFHDLLDSVLHGREKEFAKELRAYRTDIA